jgi:hypothetical protein
MRGTDPHNPIPNAGVRAACLHALIHGDPADETTWVRQMAAAQFITDDLYGEIRGMRLQLIEFCKAASGSR